MLVGYKMTQQSSGPFDQTAAILVAAMGIGCLMGEPGEITATPDGLIQKSIVGLRRRTIPWKGAAASCPRGLRQVLVIGDDGTTITHSQYHVGQGEFLHQLELHLKRDWRVRFHAGGADQLSFLCSVFSSLKQCSHGRKQGLEPWCFAWEGGPAVAQKHWWGRATRLAWPDVTGIEKRAGGELNVYGRSGEAIAFSRYHVDPRRFEAEVLKRANLDSVIDASRPPTMRL